MRLHAYQIFNCFGFLDSGEILLSDSTNVIYLLGRNSSGKTSVLTAMEVLSSDKTPGDYARFENFGGSSQIAPRVAAHCKRDGTLLSVDQLITSVRKIFERDNRDGAGSPFLASELHQRFWSTLEPRLREEYQRAFDEVNASEDVWLSRAGDGRYFVTVTADVQPAVERQARVQAAVDSAFQQIKSPNQAGPTAVMFQNTVYNVKLPTAQSIEDVLVPRFPRIVRFGAGVDLAESLPDVITIQQLASPGSLLRAFLALLDHDQVRQYIAARNPHERERMLEAMQSRAQQVADDVNYFAASTGRGRLLDLQLAYFQDGLQITAKVGSRYAYFRHLSDNTKLLFAFYLYMRTQQLTADVLLFDEPNNGFHATAQEELLRFLEQLGKQGKLVVVATHSEHLINTCSLTGIRRMEEDETGDYLFVRNKWNSATTERGDFLALRPVMDAIGLRMGSAKLTIRDPIIVTEGPSEYAYLHAFRSLLGIPEDLNIAPANGDEAILGVVSLLISQGLQFKVVVDTKTHGKSAKTRLRDAYPIDEQSIYEVAVPSDVANATTSGIEDVFSKADFRRILEDMDQSIDPEFETVANSHYLHSSKKRVPKLAVATWFQQNLAQYPLSALDETTRARIRALMNFCTEDKWYRM